MRVHSKYYTLGRKMDASADIIRGTERTYPADLVLVAFGSGSVDVDAFGGTVPVTAKGLFCANMNSYKTGVERLFACGDCRT